MITIHHHGRAAVYVARGRATLAPLADALERDHPVRRWLACIAFYALDVEDGHLAGPYTSARAEHFARCALMPDTEFAALERHPDAVLAEHFNVPLDQVGEKRVDLRALRASGVEPLAH